MLIKKDEKETPPKVYQHFNLGQYFDYVKGTSYIKLNKNFNTSELKL